MKKVLYILCLSHSGSTLLDLLLSYHKDVVGLGEVFSVLSKKKNTIEGTEGTCSCGETLSLCKYWADLYNFDECKYTEKYNHLLEATSKYHKDVIIDSSKKIGIIPELGQMHHREELDLRVILLVKDVRGYALSAANARKRRGKVFLPYTYHIRRWYRRNKYFKRILRQNKLSFIQVSYEELCLDTEKTLKAIFDFTELLPNKFSLNNTPTTHIAYGNRMKMEFDKTFKITYDKRWFNNYWINFSALLLPHIFLCNSRTHTKIYKA